MMMIKEAKTTIEILKELENIILEENNLTNNEECFCLAIHVLSNFCNLNITQEKQHNEVLTEYFMLFLAICFLSLFSCIFLSFFRNNYAQIYGLYVLWVRGHGSGKKETYGGARFWNIVLRRLGCDFYDKDYTIKQANNFFVRTPGAGQFSSI